MLKIFKKIKYKIEGKILEYVQKSVLEVTNLSKAYEDNEILRIINRPNEGEIVKIDNIKILKVFKTPKQEKINSRRKYYKKYKYFRSMIVLNKNNYLLDGYTTYLLAKEMKFDYITLLREK